MTEHHAFVEIKPDERCGYSYVRRVAVEGGGKYTVTEPCLKTRAEHGLQ